MQRVKRSTAVAVLPAAPAGGTPGYFANPNPTGGVPATVPGYEWFNGVQEEIMAVIEQQGLVADSNDLTQLATAIKKLFQKASPSISLAGGTADAITVQFVPAMTAFSQGPIWWRATAANATTTPTLKRDALAAKTIVKGPGIPLALGDIPGAGAWMCSQYDATADKEVLLNPATGSLAVGYMLVRDEKASGTGAGASILGTQTRALNTVVRNTISGASLSGNQVTLPAGTYRIRAHAPSSGVNEVQALLYNVTDAAVLARGTSENGTLGGGSDPAAIRSFIDYPLVFSSQKVIELRMYCSAAYSTGLGAAVSQGTEVYSVMEIIKEA